MSGAVLPLGTWLFSSIRAKKPAPGTLQRGQFRGHSTHRVPEEALQRPHHLDAEDTRRAGSTIGPREARAVGLLGQWVLQFFICIPTWLSHLFIITLEQWLIAALVHTGAGWILGCRWEMPRKPRAPRRPACSASHSSTTRALWGV